MAPGTSEAWTTIEAEIGTRLPEDFKEYTRLYGAGQWGNFFGIMNPFSAGNSAKYWKDWMRKRFEGYEEFQKKWPDDTAPFPVFPKPEGLLAFGYNDNGGTLCWQTKGDPDSWRIVCLDGKLSERYDVFDMTLTGFLESLVRRKIRPKTFAPGFSLVRQPAFRPAANG